MLHRAINMKHHILIFLFLFQDEFHSRLRFIRRGLVAMANAGPHDNGSQFFFTLARADELNNKHTIFGKVSLKNRRDLFLLHTYKLKTVALFSPLMQVTGDTVYNMLRLAEVDCDHDERPLNPHKIRTTEVFPCCSSCSFFYCL